jgi:hypothetical protein
MTDDLQQAIVDTLAAASTGPIDTWLKQIEDMVRHASDLPSLQEQLLTAFGDLPENDLAELMGLAYTAARLAGMASAVDDGQ